MQTVFTGSFWRKQEGEKHSLINVLSRMHNLTLVSMALPSLVLMYSRMPGLHQSRSWQQELGILHPHTAVGVMITIMPDNNRPFARTHQNHTACSWVSPALHKLLYAFLLPEFV